MSAFNTWLIEHGLGMPAEAFLLGVFIGGLLFSSNSER
jgi:hypothetical protein